MGGAASRTTREKRRQRENMTRSFRKSSVAIFRAQSGEQSDLLVYPARAKHTKGSRGHFFELRRAVRRTMRSNDERSSGGRSCTQHHKREEKTAKRRDNVKR